MYIPQFTCTVFTEYYIFFKYCQFFLTRISHNNFKNLYIILLKYILHNIQCIYYI